MTAPSDAEAVLEFFFKLNGNWKRVTQSTPLEKYFNVPPGSWVHKSNKVAVGFTQRNIEGYQMGVVWWEDRAATDENNRRVESLPLDLLADKLNQIQQRCGYELL